MNTEIKTPATARPWRISERDSLSIKSADGKHIAQAQYDCAFNRNYETNLANAALIVQAENSYDALKAVAVAAKAGEDGFSLKTFDALRAALANLPAVL